jgi:hypothetical protein
MGCVLFDVRTQFFNIRFQSVNEKVCQTDQRTAHLVSVSDNYHLTHCMKRVNLNSGLRTLSSRTIRGVEIKLYTFYISMLDGVSCNANQPKA